MKKLILLFLLGTPLLAACVFDVPVTTDHVIAIDEAILGPWKSVPVGEDEPVRITILRFSETEYVLHYFEDDWELYFRAYPVKIGEISAVQLEVLGDDDEAVSQDAGERYMIAAYRWVAGDLEVRTLNTGLFDTEIADSNALKAEILKHEDNPELFNEPGLFKRVAD